MSSTIDSTPPPPPPENTTLKRPTVIRVKTFCNKLWQPQQAHGQKLKFILDLC